MHGVYIIYQLNNLLSWLVMSFLVLNVIKFRSYHVPVMRRKAKKAMQFLSG
ncbi:hypothetical protein BH18THE1_BH18THE1_05040 [soil metagenome]